MKNQCFHSHADHWDEIAAAKLAKDIPFFVQNDADFKIIQDYGFTNLRIIDENGTDFEGIKLYKTKTHHGVRHIFKPLFEKLNAPYDAMGVVFQATNNKTLYIAGDTIWCDEVKNALDKFSPSVIIINACGASSIINGKREKAIMDLDDVKEISSYEKNTTIIASHMDTVSHLTVTREDIKNLKLKNVLIPFDNETLKLKLKKKKKYELLH